MKTVYEVVEYRGCGIEYSVFQGSHSSCEQWLRDNCYEDVAIMGDKSWVSKDPTCVNGNGFPFRYVIREISE